MDREGHRAYTQQHLEGLEAEAEHDIDSDHFGDKPEEHVEPRLPCPNWVFANNASHHVTKDLWWFSNDYLAFDSEIITSFGQTLSVVGIGTVILPTKLDPAGPWGRDNHGFLRLTNVLHVPDTICNVIGGSLTDDYTVVVQRSEQSAGTIKDDSGRTLAYFKPLSDVVKLLELRLSGRPIGPKCGPSALKPGEEYVISVHWPVEQRRRFETFKKQQKKKPPFYTFLSPGQVALMTYQFGSEADFMEANGLDPNTDIGYQKGRKILSRLMREDHPRYLDDDFISDDDMSDCDIEDGFTRYLLPHQKNWIQCQQRYGNPQKFMVSHGLHLQKDYHCDLGQAIVEYHMGKVYDAMYREASYEPPDIEEWSDVESSDDEDRNRDKWGECGRRVHSKRLCYVRGNRALQRRGHTSKTVDPKHVDMKGLGGHKMMCFMGYSSDIKDDYEAFCRKADAAGEKHKPSALLTKYERMRLEKEWGSELNFLQCYCELSGDDPKDREFGRMVCREGYIAAREEDIESWFPYSGEELECDSDVDSDNAPYCPRNPGMGGFVSEKEEENVKEEEEEKEEEEKEEEEKEEEEKEEEELTEETDNCEAPEVGDRASSVDDESALVEGVEILLNVGEPLPDDDDDNWEDVDSPAPSPTRTRAPLELDDEALNRSLCYNFWEQKKWMNKWFGSPMDFVLHLGLDPRIQSELNKARRYVRKAEREYRDIDYVGRWGDFIAVEMLQDGKYGWKRE